MSRAAAGVALFVLASRAAPAQGVAVTVGPQFVLASYREVASGLRYQGSGFGGAASARYRKLSAEVGVVRLTLDPATGSAATNGFTATLTITSGFTDQQNVATIVQSALAQIGVTINIQSITTATFSGLWTGGKLPFFITKLNPAINDVRYLAYG